jgi:hypothetical protein
MTKLNGQQKAQQNLDGFQTWVATQTDGDFTQIVFRGQLNRGEVAKAIGCGKSALRQNPALKEALEELENVLRGRGVLAPLSVSTKRTYTEPKEYDNTANRRMMDSKRVGLLEQENIELKAQVKELKSKLERFGELSGTLAEMGFMPR